MKKIYKFSGAGNDFVVIDGREGDVSAFREVPRIEALCKEFKTDGLMILGPALRQAQGPVGAASWRLPITWASSPLIARPFDRLRDRARSRFLSLSKDLRSIFSARLTDSTPVKSLSGRMVRQAHQPTAG